MMKKFLAIATAAVLALGCFATASAAKLEYSVGDDTAWETFWADKSVGELTEVGGMSWKGKDYTLAAFDTKAKDEDDVEKSNRVAYSHLRAQAKVTDGKIVCFFNITCKDADPDEPAEIIIPYDKAKSGQAYSVWRYNTKSHIWNNTDVKVTKVENGKIYAAVKEVKSPVALVKGGSTTADANKDASASKTGAAATNGKAAPKTGEV